MYSHDAGLLPALVVGGVLAFLFLASLQHAINKGKQSEGSAEDSDRHLKQLDSVALALGLAFGAAAFCLTFAVLNPLLQLELMTWPEVKRQWFEGAVTLRLTTIYFTALLMWRALSYVLDVNGLGGTGKPTEFETEFQTINPVLNDKDRRLRDLCQSAIFIGALATLWGLSAKGVSTPETAILSWVFGFFSDDWLIMLSYSRELKGRLFKADRRRLVVVNALLIVPLGALVWREWGWLIVLWVPVMLGIVAVRYQWKPWIDA
ncbi:hypothetical protein [Streptomyces telluris]|uniref:Uncharacterized protein n=1 Tax=Streptomyces telluris TaxID=2720021 RepID=A0A9X2LD10_9ACTN|nr:hypothetical protein [Streptomyces telluris]MCQ8768925.1 hypothetical protein [Streptomyces telluris]NJP77650.1 hypothetical protein [Streptomyces telluris]